MLQLIRCYCYPAGQVRVSNRKVPTAPFAPILSFRSQILGRKFPEASLLLESMLWMKGELLCDDKDLFIHLGRVCERDETQDPIEITRGNRGARILRYVVKNRGPELDSVLHLDTVWRQSQLKGEAPCFDRSFYIDLKLTTQNQGQGTPYHRSAKPPIITHAVQPNGVVSSTLAQPS